MLHVINLDLCSFDHHTDGSVLIEAFFDVKHSTFAPLFHRLCLCVFGVNSTSLEKNVLLYCALCFLSREKQHAEQKVVCIANNEATVFLLSAGPINTHAVLMCELDVLPTLSCAVSCYHPCRRCTVESATPHADMKRCASRPGPRVDLQDHQGPQIRSKMSKATLALR